MDTNQKFDEFVASMRSMFDARFSVHVRNSASAGLSRWSYEVTDGRRGAARAFLRAFKEDHPIGFEDEMVAAIMRTKLAATEATT